MAAAAASSAPIQPLSVERQPRVVGGVAWNAPSSSDLAEAADGGDVLVDRKARVPAVRGVDDELEELLSECGVGRLHQRPSAIDVGEGPELAGAQELDVPALDAGTDQAGLLDDPQVDLHVLSHGRVEGRSRESCSLRGHPDVDRGRGNRADAVLHRSLHRGQQLRDHAVLVRRILRIHSAEHHDEIDVEAERAEFLDHLIDIAVVAAGEHGDLHAVHRDAGGGAEFAHAGDDLDLAGFVARIAAGLIRHEAADETQVGGHDAESDGGFEDDFVAHANQ